MSEEAKELDLELREWLESLDYVLAERSPDHVRQFARAA